MKFRVVYGIINLEIIALNYGFTYPYVLNSLYCSHKAAEKAFQKYKPRLIPIYNWKHQILQIGDGNGL